MTLLTIAVDVVAGTDIRNAASEAIRVATELRVAVRFGFNGTICTVGPDTDPDTLVSAFHRARDDGHGFAYSL